MSNLKVSYFFAPLFVGICFSSYAYPADFLTPQTIFYDSGNLVAGNNDGESLETGVIDGIPYKISHKTGAATFGDWSVECSVDRMTDVKHCHAVNNGLWIYKFKKGWIVSVGADNFPGKPMSIRVDSMPAMYASQDGWSGNAASRVVNKLKRAKTILTRYEEWPYERYIDNDINPKGLRQAIDYMTFVIGKHK